MFRLGGWLTSQPKPMPPELRNLADKHYDRLLGG
jgi:hypothetical protein